MSWTGVGEAYAASYAPLCLGTARPLLAALEAPVGRTLLDVGAGTGDLAARFAEAGWAVTACEPEASMREAAERRHPDLPLVGAGLPVLPFPDAAFDVVMANFVLNHVPDPRLAAAELARVSSGIVVATTWSASASWLWADAVERSGVIPPPPDRLPAEKDFERSAAGFARMLEEAGWQGADVSEHTWIWDVAPEVLWASAEGGVAGAGAVYAGLSAEDRVRLRAGFDAAVAERIVDGILSLEHTAAIVVARVLAA